jgi:hypothetical protein
MATIGLILFILGFSTSLLLEYLRYQNKPNKRQNAY